MQTLNEEMELAITRILDEADELERKGLFYLCSNEVVAWQIQATIIALTSFFEDPIAVRAYSSRSETIH